MIPAKNVVVDTAEVDIALLTAENGLLTAWWLLQKGLRVHVEGLTRDGLQLSVKLGIFQPTDYAVFSTAGALVVITV